MFRDILTLMLLKHIWRGETSASLKCFGILGSFNYVAVGDPSECPKSPPQQVSIIKSKSGILLALSYPYYPLMMLGWKHDWFGLLDGNLLETHWVPVGFLVRLRLLPHGQTTGYIKSRHASNKNQTLNSVFQVCIPQKCLGQNYPQHPVKTNKSLSKWLIESKCQCHICSSKLHFCNYTLPRNWKTPCNRSFNQ
jgi:hypothetical protein